LSTGSAFDRVGGSSASSRGGSLRTKLLIMTCGGVRQEAGRE
jgi:hypothetical protein